MSARVLKAYFTPEELHDVYDGVRKFIRLLGLPVAPQQARSTADEWDLTSSLELVKMAFHDSARMMGLQKYQGVDYDAPAEVKLDMEEYLLTGRFEKDTLFERRKHLPLYHLVIAPTINLFYKFDHQTMIDTVDQIVDGVIDLVNNSDAYGTADDALIAKFQVQAMVRAREEARKEQSSKRKTRKKKEVEVAEFVEEDVEQLAEAA